ncbi:MAG: hypothetical protein KatS3mg076_0977 [Candidatus Binatia bacterium]|nr:MAG: hypothetical protein KatS3mg076_0977 [Candidatus Binatia bacterium]
MTEKIKENWVWAGGAGDLETVIAFSVLSTGEIVNIRVLVPSGNPTYDLSAVRAVQAANPLPPPPFEFADQFARVEYTFRPEDAKRE